MEKRLKQCLGIDVFKVNLSLSFGFLSERLVNEFKCHADVSNDVSGHKELLKWLRKSAYNSVELLVVMEATRFTIRVSPIICTPKVIPFV